MQIDDITIRRLAASDPAVIAAAFTAIGWNKPADQYEKYFSEQQAGRRHVLVAVVNGEFAGYATVNWHPTYALFEAEGIPEIQDLNVLPGFRRRGIGSALMDAAEAAAARAQSDAVGIAVGLTQDYGAAQQLYARRGYIPDGRGITYRDRIVKYGEKIVVDDNLVLRLSKRLS